VEDLWDMPLSGRGGYNLDAVAVALSKTLKEDNVSFIKPVSRVNSLDLLRFNIVKHVIGVKLEEVEIAKDAVGNKARKQQLLKLMDNIDEEADKGRSKESLQKEFDSIN
jgi:hypothetical protein